MNNSPNDRKLLSWPQPDEDRAERQVVEEEEHEIGGWEWRDDRLQTLASGFFEIRRRTTRSSAPTDGIWASVLLTLGSFVVFFLLSSKAFEFVAKMASTATGPTPAVRSVATLLAAIASGIGACVVGFAVGRRNRKHRGSRKRR